MFLLQKVRSESLGNLTHSGGMESDRQIILTLQKSLEAEKLRNLNLSAELELQRNMSLGSGANLTGKHDDRGFYSSAPGKIRLVLNHYFFSFHFLRRCIFQ